jgi:hypothetical protein
MARLTQILTPHIYHAEYLYGRNKMDFFIMFMIGFVAGAMLLNWYHGNYKVKKNESS